MKALFVLLFVALAGCDSLGSDTPDGGDAGPVTCGNATCGASQFCLYRECGLEQRCRISVQCTNAETPTTCGGQPGCLQPSCAPVVQGCRDIPPNCSGDVTCACQTICGSVAACKSVDGKNAECAQ